MSPRPLARISGAFYLATFITGSLAFAFAGSVGVAVNVIATACYVVVVLLFYPLFKPVDVTASRVAAIVGLAGCAWGALSILHLTPIHLSSLVFFGVYCLLIGYLIFKSTFMPKILGVLMAIGGVGWLTNISPTFAKSVSPWNMMPGVFGEGCLTLWLLVFAVNEQRWNEQAGTAVGSTGQPVTA